jgi:hypothetical protein
MVEWFYYFCWLGVVLSVLFIPTMLLDPEFRRTGLEMLWVPFFWYGGTRFFKWLQNSQRNTEMRKNTGKISASDIVSGGLVTSKEVKSGDLFSSKKA